MSDSTNKASIFESDSATRDASLPIEELLNQASNNVAKETNENKPTIVEPTVSTSEKNLSPLEQLKQSKANNPGLVVSNEELENGKETGPTKNIVYNDARMGNIDESIKSFDETLDKRNCVIVVRQPQTQLEYIQMMEEIDSIEKDENGKLRFNLVHGDGEDAVAVQPVFCRLREQGESVFDFSDINAKYGENEPSDESDETLSDQADLSPEKKETVQIIIDKTGLGIDFMFTEEEKAKITEAQTIKLNEVKVLDIAAIRASKSNKSFQETINKYDYSGSRTTICFPASGFKAQMKGMTYGEYADVSISMDSVTFDQYEKRLSIIYNKMINTSCPPFKDFEDFLKNFAYSDIEMALYGLFISSEPESQEIGLVCGSNKCKKRFDWKYSSRSILRLERCADKFLEHMRELAESPAVKYDEIYNNAIVRNTKAIELPETHIVVEMGMASAYEFLYNIIPLLNKDRFQELYGDDPNDIYSNLVLLLTSVIAVHIPDEDGEYTHSENYEDIIKGLYNVTPNEIKMITALATQVQSNYRSTFSFGNVVCPHCNHITESLDVSMDELIFQRYQLLMSTEVDVNNILDL